MRIAEAPEPKNEIAGGRVVFDVVRVLKGDVPSDKLIEDVGDEKDRDLGCCGADSVGGLSLPP